MISITKTINSLWSFRLSSKLKSHAGKRKFLVNSLGRLRIQVLTRFRSTHRAATVCPGQIINRKEEYHSNVRNSSPSSASTTSTATSTVSWMCVCKHCGSLRACAPRSNFCWRHPKIPEAVYNSNPWLPPSLISTALLSQRAHTIKVKPLSSTIAECAQSSLSCFTIRKSSCYTKRLTLLKPLT
jgi:hypothetical protein